MEIIEQNIYSKMNFSMNNQMMTIFKSKDRKRTPKDLKRLIGNKKFKSQILLKQQKVKI